MRQKFLLLTLIALLATGCVGLAPANPRIEVTVSAAASLKEVLTAAQEAYKEGRPEVTLRFNFGSTGALAQQIAAGAPVDLFIAAATGPVNDLVQKGLIEASAVKRYAANEIVLVRSAAAGPALSRWEDLTTPAVTRIAIGNPAHVPAGQYGKAVLEHLQLAAPLQARLVLGEDVRQVLAFVESGEAQAGIVYASDAKQSTKVVRVAAAPAGSHPPIEYPLAVVKGAKQAEAARAFADYLLSPAGKALLTQHGFKAGE